MTTENKYHSRVGDDNIYQAQEGEYLIVSDIPPSRAHLHEGLGIYELRLNRFFRFLSTTVFVNAHLDLFVVPYFRELLFSPWLPHPLARVS